MLSPKTLSRTITLAILALLVGFILGGAGWWASQKANCTTATSSVSLECGAIATRVGITLGIICAVLSFVGFWGSRFAKPSEKSVVTLRLTYGRIALIALVVSLLLGIFSFFFLYNTCNFSSLSVGHSCMGDGLSIAIFIGLISFIIIFGGLSVFIWGNEKVTFPEVDFKEKIDSSETALKIIKDTTGLLYFLAGLSAFASFVWLLARPEGWAGSFFYSLCIGVVLAFLASYLRRLKSEKLAVVAVILFGLGVINVAVNFLVSWDAGSIVGLVIAVFFLWSGYRTLQATRFLKKKQ